MKQHNCMGCIERHLGCHSYCQTYIDFVTSKKKDKLSEYWGYASENISKRIKSERR